MKAPMAEQEVYHVTCCPGHCWDVAAVKIMRAARYYLCHSCLSLSNAHETLMRATGRTPILKKVTRASFKVKILAVDSLFCSCASARQLAFVACERDIDGLRVFWDHVFAICVNIRR